MPLKPHSLGRIQSLGSSQTRTSPAPGQEPTGRAGGDRSLAVAPPPVDCPWRPGLAVALPKINYRRESSGRSPGLCSAAGGPRRVPPGSGAGRLRWGPHAVSGDGWGRVPQSLGGWPVSVRLRELPFSHADAQPVTHDVGKASLWGLCRAPYFVLGRNQGQEGATPGSCSGKGLHCACRWML